MGKEQSKDARVGEIDWSNKKLSEISVHELHKLSEAEYEVLNISHNELTCLENIKSLKHLKKLDASRNLLTTYSGNILPGLHHLNISFNKLTSLPQSLAALSQLQEIILSNNNIVEVSPEIENLQALKFLDLSRNQIQSLPQSFGSLSMLETLYLNDNKLTTSGCKLGELFSLKMIDLSNNRLTKLPDVTFLASLQKLYINNNQLTELSPSIAFLPKLREISLRGNKLSTLPREIEGIVCLNLIDLEDNLFKESDIFSTNDISLMIKYLYGNPTEKKQAMEKCKKIVKSTVHNNAVHLSVSEFGLNRKDVKPREEVVVGYTKRLFWVKGTELQILIQKVPVSHRSLNDGDCFVFDIGKKIFVWQGAESNPYERAKAEHWGSLLAKEQGNAPLIILDAGVFEDSPLLPEGFAFWDELGGKGTIGTADDSGDDELLPIEKLKEYQFFSVIENDANGRCDVTLICDGRGLSKEMLNSSHCFVLDCWSEIFVWAGMESTGNEKSWALLKAEELERQKNRPDCTVVSWILDRDEKLYFKEQFPDWRDENWTLLLVHTKIQKPVEVVDVSEYDKVIAKQMKEEEKRLSKGESYSDMKRKKIESTTKPPSTIKRLSLKLTGSPLKVAVPKETPKPQQTLSPPIIDPVEPVEKPVVPASEPVMHKIKTEVKKDKPKEDFSSTVKTKVDKKPVKRRQAKAPATFATEPTSVIVEKPLPHVDAEPEKSTGKTAPLLDTVKVKEEVKQSPVVKKELKKAETASVTVEPIPEPKKESSNVTKSTETKAPVKSSYNQRKVKIPSIFADEKPAQVVVEPTKTQQNTPHEKTAISQSPKVEKLKKEEKEPLKEQKSAITEQERKPSVPELVAEPQKVVTKHDITPAPIPEPKKESPKVTKVTETKEPVKSSYNQRKLKIPSVFSEKAETKEEAKPEIVKEESKKIAEPEPAKESPKGDVKTNNKDSPKVKPSPKQRVSKLLSSKSKKIKEASETPSADSSTQKDSPKIKKSESPKAPKEKQPKEEKTGTEKVISTRLARLKGPLKGPARKSRATKNPVKERARKEKEDEHLRVEPEKVQQAARRNAAAGAYGMLWALGVDQAMFGKRQAKRDAKPKEVKTTKPPHLYHVKGRRRVFIREVEISYESLNSGDVFILDGGDRVLYMWNGKKANRIEKGSALDFAKKIKDKHYFGNAQIQTLEEGKNDSACKPFWELLGTGPITSAEEGGDDNEAAKLFRDCVKLFRVEQSSSDDGDGIAVELVLVGDGPYPKEILSTEECFILDCMTEIYPWTGKKSNIKLRNVTIKKAKEMAEERPFWVAEVDRQFEGGESVLFKERFSNWSSGLPITVAQVAVGLNTAKVQLSGQVDVTKLHEKATKKEEVMIDDATGDIKIWRIEAFEKVLIENEQYGFFYSGDSYIVLYKYIWKNKDCFIIYYFQGRDSTINEKGTSAVLTIELDKEISGMVKEIRVVQYKEPKHFLQLFKGKMVIHAGKASKPFSTTAALYQIREYSNGVRGVQCHCRASSLTPMNTFVLALGKQFFVWFGKFSPESERNFALENKLLQGNESTIVRVDQGKEPKEFWEALGGKGEYPYQDISTRIEPRLFHCSVGTGTFDINEILDYCQDDLSTHDIFIVDALIDIFVWFGKRSSEKEQRWSMEAAVQYQKTSPVTRPKCSIWKVKEGEEPYLFTSHFHSWMCKKHSEQANGIHGGLEDVSDVLEQFTRTYTYEELCSGEFSKALDTANIEKYLSDEEFERVFKMNRDEFYKMPGWKRTNLKKSLSLF